MVHKSAVLSLTFSLDNKLLASGDESGTIKIWKASDGKCLKIIEIIEQDNAVTNMLLSFKNAKLIATCLDYTIKVFGLKSGNKLKEYAKVHDNFISSIQYMSS
jgi:WD40 repeat-containing protein SMU1